MKTTRSKDGTILAYDIYGSGPAMIFIAGAICFRRFKPIMKDAKTFASRFTVYVYDRRGRGGSGDTLPYSPEREVEDIEAMIDAAGGKAFVYGHSSGAVLALEAALRLPEKVTKVVLCDASYAHDDTERTEYARLRHQVSELVRAKKGAQALKTFLIGIGMPKLFVHLLPLMPGWRAMKALAPTLEYDMQLTADLPPVARAAGIRIPTQVLYGERSPIRLQGVARLLSGAISNAELRCLPGQDHMASAKVVLPLITEFFMKE